MSLDHRVPRRKSDAGQSRKESGLHLATQRFDYFKKRRSRSKMCLDANLSSTAPMRQERAVVNNPAGASVAVQVPLSAAHFHNPSIGAADPLLSTTPANRRPRHVQPQPSSANAAPPSSPFQHPPHQTGMPDPRTMVSTTLDFAAEALKTPRQTPAAAERACFACLRSPGVASLPGAPETVGLCGGIFRACDSGPRSGGFRHRLGSSPFCVENGGRGPRRLSKCSVTCSCCFGRSAGAMSWPPCIHASSFAGHRASSGPRSFSGASTLKQSSSNWATSWPLLGAAKPRWAALTFPPSSYAARTPRTKIEDAETVFCELLAARGALLTCLPVREPEWRISAELALKLPDAAPNLEVLCLRGTYSTRVAILLSKRLPALRNFGFDDHAYDGALRNVLSPRVSVFEIILNEDLHHVVGEQFDHPAGATPP
ncbi:hypothetical protein BDK51DRAFT_41852 [Blyttiomyces helicus]|uniref:Uncharacterized protein n=1 Tax=Blyttiomyces helicus TaxID=388810 RepID=A0A4P9W9F0_9FUNG|nr:hypothetical protein BDK51DRAFT_41852 [Blyttiomyces helicus]|eukprot:RKO88792.1 hypothetical protein BDK51DRAFT_41852 [Blyttiomyces helicus]